MRDGLKIVDISQLALTVILFVGILLFFLLLYPYHLFYQEQTQLFLFTSDSFLTYIQKPAWVSRYAGDFLTQFYSLHGGGALVLWFVFIVQFLLVRAVFIRMRLRENTLLFALLPVVAEWVLHTGFNYKLSFTLGFTVALLLFLLYSCLSDKKVSIVSCLLFFPLLYPLLGGHLLTFVLLVVAYDLKRGRFSSWWYWILLLAGAGLSPLLWRAYYLLTAAQSFLYPAGELAAFLPAAIVLVCLFYCAFRQDRPDFRFIRNEYNVLIGIFFVSVIVPFAGANFTREKVLSLDSEAYFGNWDTVLKKAESYELKDPVAAYYINLALAHQQALPDRLLEFYQPLADGLLLSAASEESPLAILFRGETYFFLGDMDMAQQAAMSSMHSSTDHWSSRLIKRLAEINILNEDTAAAGKYLRILDATLFHKKWARERWALMDSEETVTRLAEMRSRIPAYDVFCTSHDGLASLTRLLNRNPMNKDALDYLLCFHLLNKDIRSFLSAYDKWFAEQKREMPRLYAEALLIALASEKASPKKLAQYSIPDDIAASFIVYTETYEQASTDGAQSLDGLSHTYWYYYHFAQPEEQ